MQKTKKLIEHIFTKKNIKIFLLLFVFIGFFVGVSFADSTSTVSQTMIKKFTQLVHIGISIMSWGWVVLATLAGKLMTNDFVYGTFLNLDKSLRDLRNIMKNFANFALGFILIFAIVKNLFTTVKQDSDPLKNSLKIVGKVLVSGVLVQMSRFLVAAMIDVSTIATAAVGSLPSQFISSNTDFQGDMTELLYQSQAKLEIDFTTTGNIVDAINTGNLNTEEDVKQILDTITPGPDSMVGPFIFLGASVFNLYDLTDTSKNLSGTDDWEDLFLSLGINGFVLFMFSVMLAFIFLFNLFRVITLWVVIPLSPIIIVLSFFLKDGKSENMKGFFGDVINYENILKLIFKPVYMTLVLSIVLIAMVLVRSLVKSDNGNLDLQQHNNLTVVSKKVGSGDAATYNSSLDVGNIASINMKMKDSIVDLLVYLIALILLGLLVKSCVSGSLTGIGFIDNKINTLSKALRGGDKEFGGILGQMGVIPIGKDENGKPIKVGIGTLGEYMKQNDNLMDRKLRKSLGIDVSEQNDLMRDWFGINNTSFSTLNSLVDDKKAWLKSAVTIGKESRNYTKLRQLLGDEDFMKARSYYESKNKNKNPIYQEDLEKAWNGDWDEGETSSDGNSNGSKKTSSDGNSNGSKKTS